MLTAEGLLEQKVFGWCQNESMDDAEVTVVRQCLPHVGGGNCDMLL